MNVKDFTYFLEHPTKVVEPIHTKHLEDIIAEYPYFQAARALHLKGLKNLNSYKYNKALKTTAAFTTDRDVLFEFITSKDFLRYDRTENTVIIEPESKVEPPKEPTAPLIENSEDKPLPQDTTDAEHILDPELFQSKPTTVTKEEETLEIGKPLTFNEKEKYSFSEWLSLASKKPISTTGAEQTSSTVKAEKVPEKKAKPVQKLDAIKKKKFERIDKFIASNPKIDPTEQKGTKLDISNSIKIDKNELMTETLARVYLEQKKYKKAIQAFKILSLKYPEKSSFFADRIKAVEKIQKANK
ncbi:hypothetical protein SAMN04488009_2197 [Maribacter sedimenticola]|uniref:Tetratricopeptide repeat protein n=1 Tax=Maribacter sedimenticola TaxID=228956 RepID=A0ABY1SIC6_9FLAO|nr:hypothetical protein [Maribacter sedimenticola]SNR53434.1 hypothetical protein SAMN04488009_2197 [Maribacter sedimenticola]